MSEVQKLYQEIQNIDLKDPNAKDMMMKTLKSYDESFQQQKFIPTPAQLSQTYKAEQSKIELPQNGSEVEKQLKSQFIADGSIFGEYQAMLRQAKVPAYVVPPPPPPKPEEEVANVFLRVPYNYLDQNANSKLEGQFQSRQVSQMNPMMLQQQQFNPIIQNSLDINNQQKMDLQMQMNNTPSGLDSDFITKIKKTVNVLGGIEDTVQIMKQSLKDYELQQQVEKKIEQQPIFKNSTLINQQKINFQPTQYHPFERYISTEQLRVIEQSQKLREQKLQQHIHY